MSIKYMNPDVRDSVDLYVYSASDLYTYMCKVFIEMYALHIYFTYILVYFI